MAPKRKIVATGPRKKKPSTEPHVEKRRREVEAETSERSSGLPPAPSMVNRAVTTGRVVRFDFLEEENFRIGSWLINQGWKNFCSLNVPSYFKLVKEFFENLRIGSSQLISRVKGTSIILDEERLSTLFEMPRDGIYRPVISGRLEYFQCILETENVNSLKSLLASQLSAEMRLLHSIVGRIIFPKTGRFDWVAERDLAVMFNLIKGNQMNLPFMILENLKETAKKTKACLPYGMMFTVIFKHFNVNLEGEQEKKLVHTDFYNDKSLIRMGYKKVNDRWIKKDLGQKIVRDESDDEEEDVNLEIEHQAQHEAETHIPDSPATPPPAPSTAQVRTPAPAVDLSQVTDNLMEKMTELFTGLKEEILQKQVQLEQKIDTQCNIFREEIQEVTARLDEMERKSSIQPENSEIKSEITRTANAVEDFMGTQQAGYNQLRNSLGQLEIQMGILLGRTIPSAPSRPAPTPSPRPPFSSTVRPGTGFPSQPPPHSSYSRRPKKPSTSKPFVELPDSSSSSD